MVVRVYVEYKLRTDTQVWCIWKKNVGQIVIVSGIKRVRCVWTCIQLITRVGYGWFFFFTAISNSPRNIMFYRTSEKFWHCIIWSSLYSSPGGGKFWLWWGLWMVANFTAFGIFGKMEGFVYLNNLLLQFLIENYTFFRRSFKYAYFLINVLFYILKKWFYNF